MKLAEDMSRALGLSIAYIEKTARSASYHYKTYTIPKRSGGTRTICHPSKALKALQRWLVDGVISKWPVHSAATAYRKGASILQNATPHAISKFLLRMDFTDFFESLTEADIEKYFHQHPGACAGWDAADKELFAKLVCRHGKLTIGAPSSPALSNALCYDLDGSLDLIARSNSCVYTRYADDLFFSTDSPDVLRAVQKQVETHVSTMALPKRLTINASKTRHSSKKRRRQVTGLVLTSDSRAVVGRDMKRKIRHLVFRYDQLGADEKKVLAGLISYVVGIEPDFANSLINKYGLSRYEQARGK